MHLKPRDHYLQQLRAFDEEPSLRGMVRVITGVRRCGKSSLLTLYRQHLEQNGGNVLSINFEDLSQVNLREGRAFHEHVADFCESSTNSQNYLHVDEIQELEDWARVINSLRLREDLTITVTGSNSSMFSGEGLTYLSGRYIQLDMLPLGLSEYRAFTDDESALLEDSYARWLRGTLPPAAAVHDPQVLTSVNNAIFDSIFTRDIALRGMVQDPQVFLRVARVLFDSVGSPVSINKIANSLTSAGYKSSHHTVEKYVGLLKDAHMFYPCGRVGVRGREHLRNSKKYYFVDPGLRDALLGRQHSNLGHDLENMVFLELLRRGYAVHYGQSPAGEIDFVAESDGDTIYIQVALTALEEVTLRRELSSFSATPPGARCVLLTMDRLPLDTGHIQWRNAAEFLVGAAL